MKVVNSIDEKDSKLLVEANSKLLDTLVEILKNDEHFKYSQIED
jgi:hypothetical protein